VLVGTIFLIVLAWRGPMPGHFHADPSISGFPIFAAWYLAFFRRRGVVGCFLFICHLCLGPRRGKTMGPTARIDFSIAFPSEVDTGFA